MQFPRQSPRIRQPSPDAQQQHLLHLSSVRFASSSSSPKQQQHGRQQQQQMKRRKPVERGRQHDSTVVPPSVAALRDVVGHLSQLQQQVAGQHPVPVWESDRRRRRRHGPTKGGDEQQRAAAASFLENVIATDTLLREYLSDGVIQADGRHRHEFSVMVEHLLRLYAHCSAAVVGSDDDAAAVVITAQQKATALADLLSDYRANLLLAHTDALMAIAAHAEDWSQAVRWYHTHLDPAVATPGTAIASTGLYCVGRLAQEQGTLPVESVFEAVKKLAMTTPEESEKRKYNTR